MDKIRSNFYEKYVGSYAKRFYTHFKEEHIFKVIGFRIKRKMAEVEVTDGTKKWWWDVEDCVFITDEQPIIEDERVVNVFDPEYKGWNPFLKTNNI